MANVKYLSLEGLARTIAHIRLNFGAALSSSASATDYTVNLLNKSITPAIIGTTVINAATTTSAGVMTKTDKSNLDSLTTNAVKTINSGTGITVTKSGNTATVSLNAANKSTIGGIKVASVGTGASNVNTADNANKFAVHIDSNGLGYVAIPQYSNNQGDITGVTAGNGLTDGGTSGTVTLNVGAGEGISVTGDAVAIKAATDAALGGIKVWNKTSSYTVTASTTAISANVNGGKYYAVQTDKYDKAFVYVPWADIPTAIKNPKAITFTAGTFSGTPSYDGSAAKTINIPTNITHLTRQSLTVGTKSYDGSTAITINKEDLGLSNALVYKGIATESIIEDSATATYKIGSKTYTATNGDVVFYEDFEFVWNGEKWERLGGNVNYKVVQQPLTDNVSGNGIRFVDTVSQDGNGVITVTKKDVAFPKLSTATAASTATDAIVLGGITVTGHTITAQTKTIVAGSNITVGTTTAGKIYISGTADTKVTAVDKHYTPTTANNSTKSASGGNIIDISTTNTAVITGVNIDAAGHLTSVNSTTLKSTDSKVTAVDKHYTPTTANNSTLTGAISGNAGAYAINTEYTVLTGVSLQKDAAGHVTGLTYTAQKIKDTNVDTKVTSVDNHYAPQENSASQLNASGATTPTDITNNNAGVQVVTGLKRDAKGHVVGVISTALKSTNTNTTYTVSAPLSMSSNKISLTYVNDSTSTMLKASGTTAATFADTSASSATIVTHNKLGVLNNALCAEIDTITAYEIDALFS
jgi:hypothetical protein